MVVVDDGSSTVPVATRAGVRRSGAARGRRAGGGAQHGLRGVETELVAFLDSDTIPPRDWIERLAGHFDDPLVAAVAPRVQALNAVARRSTWGPGRKVRYVPERGA